MVVEFDLLFDMEMSTTVTVADNDVPPRQQMIFIASFLGLSPVLVVIIVEEHQYSLFFLMLLFSASSN